MICPIPIQQLEHLSEPRSVTVIGASNKPSKWGANVFSRVLFSPHARGVCPTNNGTQRVLGIGAYPTVRNIPGPVEPALVEMLRHSTGHLTRIGGATMLGPRESARLANAIQKSLVENTQMGIPANAQP